MDHMRARVRCRACGHLVTHGLSVCPHCGHHPLRFHTRWRATLLSVLAGLVAGIVLFPLVPHPDFAATSASASETPRVVAVRPTFTPTRTPTSSPPTATATSTATSPPPPTATNTPARAAASTPTATSAPPSATPRAQVEPPRLLSPKDQTEFGGEDTEIFLQWEGALQEGQQFAVTARYIGKADETKTIGSWLRDMRWRVPNTVFRDISLSLRALKWDVSVIDANGNALSAPSESRIFYWR